MISSAASPELSSSSVPPESGTEAVFWGSLLLLE
jgi:hypothetical protein